MKWISVDEENTPKVAMDVIVYSKTFGVGTGFYAPVRLLDGDCAKKEWLYRNQETSTSFRVDDITHWMELPSAPEIYQEESDRINADIKGGY